LLFNRRSRIRQARADIRLRELRESGKEVGPVVFLKVLEDALDRNPSAAHDRLAGHDVRILGDAVFVVMGFVAHMRFL
jgi:hypothetical protein